MGKKMRIVVCLGSSCFARGNEHNLEIIERFVEKHRLGSEVLIGSLCENCCGEGPNIKINDTMYHAVENFNLEEILERELLGGSGKAV